MLFFNSLFFSEITSEERFTNLVHQIDFEKKGQVGKEESNAKQKSINKLREHLMYAFFGIFSAIF